MYSANGKLRVENLGNIFSKFSEDSKFLASPYKVFCVLFHVDLIPIQARQVNIMDNFMLFGIDETLMIQDITK